MKPEDQGRFDTWRTSSARRILCFWRYCLSSPPLSFSSHFFHFFHFLRTRAHKSLEAFELDSISEDRPRSTSMWRRVNLLKIISVSSSNPLPFSSHSDLPFLLSEAFSSYYFLPPFFGAKNCACSITSNFLLCPFLLISMFSWKSSLMPFCSAVLQRTTYKPEIP